MNSKDQLVPTLAQSVLSQIIIKVWKDFNESLHLNSVK